MSLLSSSGKDLSWLGKNWTLIPVEKVWIYLFSITDFCSLPSFQPPRCSHEFSSISLRNPRTLKNRKAAWSKERNFIFLQGTVSNLALNLGQKGVFSPTKPQISGKNHHYLLVIWHYCSYTLLPGKRSNAEWYNISLSSKFWQAHLGYGETCNLKAVCRILIERGGKNTRDFLLLSFYV